MKKRKIDVIIPTYKPGEEFGKLIYRLEEQEYRPDRILVMNTGKQYWNTEWEKSSILEVHHLEQKNVLIPYFSISAALFTDDSSG